MPLLGWWHWCWHGNLVDLQGARGVSSASAATSLQQRRGGCCLGNTFFEFNDYINSGLRSIFNWSKGAKGVRLFSDVQCTFEQRRSVLKDRIMETFSVIPSPKVSDTVVEPYLWQERELMFWG